MAKNGEAAADGLFYLGSPCLRGHAGVRYRCSGGCVECKKEKDKKAVRSKDDLERMKVASRLWYERNKAERAIRQKERRVSDVAAYRLEQKTSYEKHREKRLAKCKEYYENNKGKSFAKVAKRRAIRAGVGGVHTEKDIERIFKHQKGRCAGCGEVLSKYHRDHIMPLALGGGNDAKNIQLLCPPCNLEKHARHPIDFMQSRGFLL